MLELLAAEGNNLAIESMSEIETNAVKMSAIGNAYYDGKWADKSYEKAFHWFQKAALLDDKDAIFQLGICYYHGRGVEENYSLAQKWWRKSADKGNTAAMYNLGLLYESWRDKISTGF